MLDAFETERRERALNGLALRVENPLLRANQDPGLQASSFLSVMRS
jgi:hypothetical protein